MAPRGANHNQLALFEERCRCYFLQATIKIDAPDDAVAVLVIVLKKQYEQSRASGQTSLLGKGTVDNGRAILAG